MTVTCLGVVLEETVQGREWRGVVRPHEHVVVTRDSEIPTRWYAYAHFGEVLDRFHVRIAHTPQAAADLVGEQLERGARRLARAVAWTGGLR